MLINADALGRFVAEIFHAKGCDREEAARVGTSLVGANLTGHDSHGVVRVPRYVQYVDEGKLVPGQQPSVVTESGSMALLDGNYGFGQTIGPAATERGIAMAAQHGVAVIAVRNSGHMGRIGEYAEMAAAQNQFSVHFVNVAGALLVAPFGGVERRFSTAPFAAGVPQGEAPPIILDFATSVVAEGKALVAYNGGKPIPGNALITPDGELSADPLVLYGADAEGPAPNPRNGPGALRAMGDHKGSGLALICELLAGALTGSGCAGPTERQVANGMLSLYMAVDAFDGDNAVAREVAAYAEFVKGSRPAEVDGEVLLPGEPERRTRQDRLASGVPLTDENWAALTDTARRVGLDEAAIEAAAAGG
ncbi:MAG: malate/lactate/ureidoglycolate dehydrogenase [Alphaproteobacteria bacterium]|nr:malate/lactate/ureidoglycolate dehydrogenase [Alphaproteobacteria bacterium]